MILFPKDSPIIENLNSYYLDIRKVFEHYQGQTAAGAVHFKSPAMQGVVFFDETEPLWGQVETREESFHGEKAVTRLIEAVSKFNFTLGVFEIPPEKLFFWTHLPDARTIYDNLSPEFTDLDGLVRKMAAEKFTGVIEIKGQKEAKSGAILFENGEILDVISPMIAPDLSSNAERLESLAAASRNGGSFSVRQVVAEPAPDSDPASSSEQDESEGGDYAMLEELMDIFERAVSSLKKDFRSLFRRRCIDNADRFDFLDPFVGEFFYENKRISFTGDAGEEALTRGLLDTLNELADDLNISAQVRHALKRWETRWESRLRRYDIRL